MDQLIEMYVEDRNKLNTLFLSHDHSNRNDPSSNNNDGDDNNPPPGPQPPPDPGTGNPPDPSTGDGRGDQTAGDSTAKSAHKFLMETQSVPFTKMSFNLVEQVNDQNSEPNTPVCRNLDRPIQRGNSDLVASRIIATAKNTPMIRIVGAEQVASLNAQFRRQLRDQLQQQHRKLEQSSMHSEPSSSQTASQHTEQPTPPLPVEQRGDPYSELPLSAHPIASGDPPFDYCSRAPRQPATISHSVSFPVATSALLKRTGGQCRHCTQQQQPQPQHHYQQPPHHTAHEPSGRAQPTQRATFYRQMSYPHSSTLFMPAQSFTHPTTPTTAAKPGVPFARAAPPLPPSAGLVAAVSSIASSTTATQQPQSSTFVHHPSNHPSADHI